MIDGQDPDPRNHWCHHPGCPEWGAFGHNKVWGCRAHLPPGFSMPGMTAAVPPRPAPPMDFIGTEPAHQGRLL
jgi:hypothetical protein